MTKTNKRNQRVKRMNEGTNNKTQTDKSTNERSTNQTSNQIEIKRKQRNKLVYK